MTEEMFGRKSSAPEWVPCVVCGTDRPYIGPGASIEPVRARKWWQVGLLDQGKAACPWCGSQ